MKEIIVGRAGAQPFPIKADGVSGEHCKITITDDGRWLLKDLKGDDGNGTFVRNPNGDFDRVYSKEITEHTVIRLGSGGHHSHTFMAHRAFDTSGTYGYEFYYLKQVFDDFRKEEEDREKTNANHTRICRWAPIFSLVLSLIVTNVWLVRLCITLPPFFLGQLFLHDPDKLKQIRIRRSKIVVCPHCGRPLSEFDINNMQCSACRAR